MLSQCEFTGCETPARTGQKYCSASHAPLGFMAGSAGGKMTPERLAIARELNVQALKYTADGTRAPGTELETRTCVCGCGQAFRCLFTSKQKYASADCQQVATGEAPKFTPARRRRPVLKEIPMPAASKASLVSSDGVREAQTDFDADNADETEVIGDQEEVEESENEREVVESDGREEATEVGHGRFTMTIPEALESFDLKRGHIDRMIRTGVIQSHQASPRKTYIDPVDIGKYLEGDGHAIEGVSETKPEKKVLASQTSARQSPQPAARSPQPAARSPQPAARSPQPAARRRNEARTGRSRRPRIGIHSRGRKLVYLHQRSRSAREQRFSRCSM